MSIFRMNKYKDRKPVPRSVWTNPIHFVACGFGVGTIPWMPGTFGTLVGVALYLVLSPLPIWAYVLITAVLIVIGVFICDITNRDFGTDDHPAAVWDEIATFLIVMIAVPKTWYFILIGFLLFRFFDIVKPWPIGWIDKNIHGGVGVMLDDVVAALFSWAILQFIVWVF